MKNKRTHLLAVVVLGLLLASPAVAKNDDFNSVVKMIEKFYGVKHQGLPFLAKAVLKVARPVGKITGGDLKKLADLGSIKIATFEDQEFRGDLVNFRASLNTALGETWIPFAQTTSREDEQQSYIFVRPAGEKFTVMVINLEPGDGAVVQATLSEKSLAELLKHPENASKRLSREANSDDEK